MTDQEYLKMRELQVREGLREEARRLSEQEKQAKQHE